MDHSSAKLLTISFLFISILLGLYVGRIAADDEEESRNPLQGSLASLEGLVDVPRSGMRPSAISVPAPTPAPSLLSDVEPEPGLVWPLTTAATTTTAAGSGTGGVEEGGALLSGGRVAAHLQRITERLSSIESLQVQTMRKLEGLDYRMTRVEVQMQERGDLARDSSADGSRRLQQIEADVGRIETLLEVMRDESTAIRSGQSELKVIMTTMSSGSAAPARAAENDLPVPRLQLLMAGMNNLRTTANGLKEELSNLHKNVSTLVNLTSTVERRSTDLATRQDLLRSFTTLKSQDNAPAFRQPISSGLNPYCTERTTALPRDCHDALRMGVHQSGVQQVQPLFSSAPFFALCDMETRGGGWTVIQSRMDGSVNFLRGWSDYKYGFGNLATEFWLGLEKIHMITNQGVYELLIEVTDFGLNTATAHYKAFAIGSETEGYDIRLLGTFDGDAGDSLSYHTAMKFSTPDNDQDTWLDGNCARDHTGGWWYKGCDTSNLNGQYLSGTVPPEFEYKGMYWYDYQGPLYSLMKSRMMVRPSPNIPMNTTANKPPRAQPMVPNGHNNRPTTAPRGNGQQQTQKPKKKKDGEERYA